MFNWSIAHRILVYPHLDLLSFILTNTALSNFKHTVQFCKFLKCCYHIHYLITTPFFYRNHTVSVNTIYFRVAILLMIWYIFFHCVLCSLVRLIFIYHWFWSVITGILHCKGFHMLPFQFILFRLLFRMKINQSAN